ncbi:MAG TPA: QsdR family transcriptional regulator [Solirubrobacteraceae bacterium]|nr:QsdR family transcriptional regulator [Solirubrobacteraceae bacterium]
MSAATESRRPRRGRPATASREDVLAAARAQFMAGDRVDLTIVARDLGLGRATIYRWFGSRERLLAEVIANESEVLISRHRREVRRRGAQGLLEVFDRINRSLARAMPLRRFVEQEGAAALRLLTSSTGAVQCRGVALIAQMIEAEVAAGRYEPPADPGTLAYAIVRLCEAFLYNDAAFGIRGDHERLREVEAALLGVPRAAPRTSGSRRTTRTARSG